MVSPPNELPPALGAHDSQISTPFLASMKMPAYAHSSRFYSLIAAILTLSRKLLLRIYGPQVSHLIDRDTELSILRRLARKRIGPRLLGTFLNGRFEEFFPSRTLTRDDIKIPETSRHIAKRLKELHEGIELEEGERQGGPIAWRNWEKWVPRAKSVMAIVEANEQRKTGPVVGCNWEKFQNAVEKYKEWLYARYGGVEGVDKTLVFAHNDVSAKSIPRVITRDYCRVTDLCAIDTIWQYLKIRSSWKKPPSASYERASTVDRHRFRICQCQYSRIRICKPFCKCLIHPSITVT